MISGNDAKTLRLQQSKFFQSGRTRDLDFRLQSLAGLEQVIESRGDEILDALAADLGKPAIEAYLSEFYFLKTELRLFRKKLRGWAKPQRVGAPFFHFPIQNEIRREPFGCSLILSPWNYPFQISFSSLVASVAAGNCVIVKPSELAPASSKLISEIIDEAFEPWHVAAMEGDVEVSTQLLAEPFDFIFFTGSERVGKVVAKSAAEHLTPTVLELGGKCPVIVDKSADLEITANRIVFAKFFNAGQTCFAPDFVVAHEDVKAELSERIAGQLELFYREDLKGDLGRIINRQHFLRLQELVGGAEDCFKLGSDDIDGLFFAPRIVNDCTWESPIMKDEIFGPILPVLGYSEEVSVVERINSMPHPLALYMFSRNADLTAKLTSKIPSGSVGINDIGKQTSNLKLPFGGVGGSGMGRYRGKFGFEAFTYQRPFSRRWFVKDFFTIHPPYHGKLEKIRKYIK